MGAFCPLGQNKQYNARTDDVTRLVCIFASQNFSPTLFLKFGTAGDEARLHFSLQSKEKLLCCRRPAGGNQLSTGQLNLIFEPSSPRNKKKKQMPKHLLFFLWSG